MQLTRREFASTTAGGLSLFSWGTNAAAIARETVRHAHLELPAGPYSRTELSRLTAAAAHAAGYANPTSATALGAELTAEAFPAQFALTLHFPGATLVVRASRNASTPELTLRGKRETIELRYMADDEAFRP